MAVSLTGSVRQFKSRMSVVAGFLLRSRETHRRRAQRNAEFCRELKAKLKAQQEQVDRLREENELCRAELKSLRRENEQLRRQPPVLPADLPLDGHSYGAKMISLSIQLAQRIGIRAVPDVLATFFTWLRVDVEIPNWTSVRMWLLRAGVAELHRPIEKADDWIWMADHSNQIGQEKVLSVIGLRASHMPPPGEPLRLKDLRVLELLPGTDWKREDMACVYQQLAQRCGAPMAVIVDGAVELREGAEPLKAMRENTVILNDFKHFAANILKNQFGQSERFREFTAKLGQTRSAVQQTELSHFTPPGPRPKARFMNLTPMLNWALMVLFHLSHPHSEARQQISASRINEKLGWLRGFRSEIHQWTACQNVVSAALTFINKQGVFRGAARQLVAELQPLLSGDDRASPQGLKLCRKVAARLICFVRQAESQLSKGQRLPLSTEILESSFGLFKRLERQHSKGGFTSLLAAYGCLMRTVTPETVRTAFAEVSVKDVKAWVSDKLGQTLTSRRQAAYREYKKAA